jgi:hypothetical protein
MRFMAITYCQLAPIQIIIQIRESVCHIPDH